MLCEPTRIDDANPYLYSLPKSPSPLWTDSPPSMTDDTNTMSPEEKADRMINFFKLIAEAGDPVIICHPEGEEEAERIAKMIPIKVRIIKDKNCKQEMLAAADLSKLRMDWRELVKVEEPEFLKEKPDSWNIFPLRPYA